MIFRRAIDTATTIRSLFRFRKISAPKGILLPIPKTPPNTRKFTSVPVSPDLNRFTVRSHTADQVTEALIGQQVHLCGWLEYQRLGRFLVLRDAYGKIQLFVRDPAIQAEAKRCNLESVIAITGTVVRRPEKDVNRAMKSGAVEVVVDRLQLLNQSMANMPFLPRDYMTITETVRLEHRYVDLRRDQMLRNLRLRSRFLMSLRNHLADRFGFVEVETPTLFKATPGGAQEFVVPTRFKDQFYSLVQSPQQFKQLLMVGSIDRYFQIARCYRDEGTKSDRQPEFTQLDIEMSFTTVDQVMELIEVLLQNCWPLPDERPPPGRFPRMSFSEAMQNYGCDKPDLRSDAIITNLADDIFLYVVPQDYDETFAIKDFVQQDLPMQINTLGFRGRLHHFKYSSLAFQTDLPAGLIDSLSNDSRFKPNDFLWLAAGSSQSDCLRMLGRIRACCTDAIEVDRTARGQPRKLSFLWIYDFPLFVPNEETGQLESAHHPFTAPKPEHAALMRSEPAKVIGQSFDLVINGREIGGGSIRIADPELQKYVLNDILRCDSSTMEYFFRALSCGAPPHGGFAIGLDRLMALICQEPSLRDVIAFPKSAHGKDLMSGSPCQINDQTRKLYNLN